MITYYDGMMTSKMTFFKKDSDFWGLVSRKRAESQGANSQEPRPKDES